MVEYNRKENLNNQNILRKKTYINIKLLNHNYNKNYSAKIKSFIIKNYPIVLDKNY